MDLNPKKFKAEDILILITISLRKFIFRIMLKNKL